MSSQDDGIFGNVLPGEEPSALILGVSFFQKMIIHYFVLKYIEFNSSWLSQRINYAIELGQASNIDQFSFIVFLYLF